MNRKTKNRVDAALYSLLVFVLILGYFVNDAEASNYCREHYCADIPKDVVAINKDNWKKHSDIVPQKIADKFAQGSKRELWIFTKNRKLSAALEYRHGRIRIDEPDKLCDAITEKLKEKQVSCGHVFNGRRLKGLQSISFEGKGNISYIRIFMPLNGGSVYMVSTGRWEDLKEAKQAYLTVREIIKTMKIRRR